MQHVTSKISELISARIEPAVQYELHDLQYEGNKGCLELKIFNGPNYPYYYIQDKSKMVYVRRGDRSEPATAIEINHLILRGMNKTFDMLPSGYQLKDVSFTLFQATYNGMVDNPLEVPRDLQSMKLLNLDGKITNAGLLLCDQGLLNQSRVVCTRWKGVTKGTIGEDALDDKVLEKQSLISLLKDAEAFVRNNSKNPWTIRGMQREERSDYPNRAVREALVNALMHRDYQNIGSEVHVDMFDDRLEIMSPGGMINGSRIQDLDLYRVPSMRRNEVISDIFGRLRFMERRGSGIRRILEAYEGTGLKVNFYSDDNMFCVSLPNKSEASSIKAADQGGRLHREILQNVSDVPDLGDMYSFIKRVHNIFGNKRADRFIRFASNYGEHYSFSRKNIAEYMGITEQSASNLMKKGVDEGLIRKEKRGTYYFVIHKINKI